MKILTPTTYLRPYYHPLPAVDPPQTPKLRGRRDPKIKNVTHLIFFIRVTHFQFTHFSPFYLPPPKYPPQNVKKVTQSKGTPLSLLWNLTLMNPTTP